VTAWDAFGNIATSYGGTVKFTSSDNQAVLPGDNTLTLGAGVFTVVLKTAGSQWVTATDSLLNNIAGTVVAAVSPLAANTLLISGISGNVTGGQSFGLTVKAVDLWQR
jgi:hypothetical protein